MTIHTPEKVLGDPTTSTWLRDALATALLRDPCDAEREAAVLWQLLHARALEAVRATLGAPPVLELVADAIRSTGHVTNSGTWEVAEAVIAALGLTTPLRAPDGVIGELVEMGEGEDGCPRLVVATTRDAIRSQAQNLVFHRVRVSLASPPVGIDAAQAPRHG